MLLPVGSAEVEEVVPEQQAVVVVGTKAARFEVDDRLDVREGVSAGFDDFVDLFLVFGKVNPRPGVVDEVLHLGSRVRRIEAGRHGSDGDGREVEDHPLGTVFGVDRHDVAALNTEGEQAVRHEDDLFPELGPRPLLPDPEAFVAHGDAVGGGERPFTDHEGHGATCAR